MMRDEVAAMGWMVDEVAGLCKWNSEYVIWDDGVMQTCVVDTSDCVAGKICATEDEIATLLNHARNHALICPEDKNPDDCPIRYQDVLGNAACSNSFVCVFFVCVCVRVRACVRACVKSIILSYKK